MAKYSYFSLVTDEFVPGVICLVKSLRKLTDVPIHVLDVGRLSAFNRWQIESAGAICDKVKKITSAKAKRQWWHVTEDFADVCYNKLHLWNTSYDKIVYFDADMIVTKNMDHLFEQETTDFASVPTFYQKTEPVTGKILEYGWDDRFFNAGFLVLRPDKSVFNDMMWLKDTLITPDTPLDTTDQSFLNEYYKGRWHKLGRGYNAFKCIYQRFKSVWDEMADDIHAIHYNLEKPWQKSVDKCDGIEKIWWNYYN